jgi:hypothetical protein
MTKIGIFVVRISQEVGPRSGNEALLICKVNLQSRYCGIQDRIRVVVSSRKISPRIRNNINGIVVFDDRRPASKLPATVHHAQLHGPAAIKIIGTISI